MLAWLNPSVVREAIERERAGKYHGGVARSDDGAMGAGIVGCACMAYPRRQNSHHCPRGCQTYQEHQRNREAQAAAWTDAGAQERFTRERPMRIESFTGKDWKRKGLPRLVEAAESLERMEASRLRCW